ncbi:helix-turn-helix domain-containing GNAT family N-acetyltransferase [Mesorhizobium sp. KR2-14]|uniref:bifunctional helix-turn-helix transcriptional regulator/GNAT family N-acetyltransferase n=1 Tax=Mesorhizobium sp. KR2-14 TaxID=3156610 RepID=UPI0032B46216
MDNSKIAQIRSFNRAVTRRVGALEESYLSRGRPLGEARVLFEIGPEGAALGGLRSRLGLDSGYLSRILRSLEAQGLVSVEKLDGDARSRYAKLTATGLKEHAAYDALSDELANSVLEPLSHAGRDRLVAAMAEVERLLAAASVTIDEEDTNGAEAQQCVALYVEELASRFEEGFDTSKGSTATGDEFTRPRGSFLIARLDGDPVGCGAVRMLDATTAEIKRMWVSPAARGLGVAGRMLRRLEAIARELGAQSVCLDTNRSLKEAQSLYLREGYEEVARFNDNPYADHWYSKRL